MSFFSYNILKSYYIADPKEFVATVTGDSYVSEVYQNLIAQIIEGINSQFKSFNATVVRLDFDGNVLFSNNDAVFGHSKDDIKNMPGSVMQCTPKEVFLADAINKKALIIEVISANYSEIIQSYYSSSNETFTQEDSDFISAAFSNLNIQLNSSKVIWEYDSSNYITSFYLVPEDTRQVLIYDDGIRDAYSWIRQGQTIEWINNSSKPISIYSGKTNYDQFNLDPDLNLYGGLFKSGILQPGESYSHKFVTVDDYDWFIYPDILSGRITVTEGRINSQDKFLILENDGLDQPFSSRVIKVDSWGNVTWSMGESYLTKPRDARPLLNNNVIIST